MQKLGGFSNRLPFCCFRLRFRLRSSPHLLHSFLGFIPSSPVPRLRRPHFAHARAHSRVHSRTPAPPPISVFCLHPSPLYPNSLFINTQGVNISPTPSPSPHLHLPSRDSPQPATEKSHFFQHFPRISLATLPTSPTAKSATEQVKVFSSKPSPLTL